MFNELHQMLMTNINVKGEGGNIVMWSPTPTLYIYNIYIYMYICKPRLAVHICIRVWLLVSYIMQLQGRVSYKCVSHYTSFHLLFIGHIKHRPLILDVSHPNSPYICSKQYISLLDVSRQTNLPCGSSVWTIYI